MFLQVCFIIASRHHYTVDVVVALLYVPMLWFFFEKKILPRDRLSPRQIAIRLQQGGPTLSSSSPYSPTLRAQKQHPHPKLQVAGPSYRPPEVWLTKSIVFV